MGRYRFAIVVEKDEDGIFVASCPALQGCYSQGETYAEAVENLRDAIRLHIEAREEADEPLPLEVSVDTIEVNV